jgi:hypothetical protein
MNLSGNTKMALNDYAQGKANQNYFSYLNALNPYFNLGVQGQTGLSAALGQGYGGLASDANNWGTNRANLESKMRLAEGQGALDTAENKANLQARLGDAETSLTGAQYTADQQAKANQQQMWMQLLGLGTQLAAAPFTGGASLAGAAGSLAGGMTSGVSNPEWAATNAGWFA